MAYLLNVIYLALVLLGSPYFLYMAIRRGKYREGFAEKFWGRLPRREGDQPCAWFHAVSVGEVVQLGPLVKEFQRRFPQWQVVVTTTTKTGLAVAQERFPGAVTCYCPLDFSWAVNNAMRRIRPDILMLVELEIWPNLIRAAKRYGSKVAIVNGRISSRSFRGYRRIRPFFASLLNQVDWLGVQNDVYRERFTALGVEESRLRVMGSIKFDGAETDRQNELTTQLRDLAGLKDADIVWLVGSTIEPEEEVALRIFRRVAADHPQLRLILAPRHPDRCSQLRSRLDKCGAWQLRSELHADPHAGSDGASAADQARILVVDTVGELKAWWGTADIAYVGGSWRAGRGGQNMIEPAAYGAAVSFGAYTENFRDVVRGLLEKDAAVIVRREEQLEAFVRKCIEDPDFRQTIGSAAQDLVRQSAGATARTVDELSRLLGDGTGRPERYAA